MIADRSIGSVRDVVRTCAIIYGGFTKFTNSNGDIRTIMCVMRAQSAIARIYFITTCNKVSLAIELDPDMEHISLASNTSLRRVRLVAHALAPQVEVELLEGMQQQYILSVVKDLVQ